MRRLAVAGLQLLAAFACAAVFIALAFSKIEPSKVWAVWFTAILYGYLCYLSKNLWRRTQYWIALLACLSAHVAILLAVQRAYPRIPLLYYVVFGSIEGGAVYWLLLGVAG